MRKLFIFGFFFSLFLLAVSALTEPVQRIDSSLLPTSVWFFLTAAIVGLHTPDQSREELLCAVTSLVGTVWMMSQIGTAAAIFAANYFGIMTPDPVGILMEIWRGKGIQ